MIVLTRLNGQTLALNCDLIERVESVPNTIVTMVDGTKHLVAEPLDIVIELIRQFRASVVALSSRLEFETPRARLHLIAGGED